MKVIESEPVKVFKPFSIEIETEEEAKMLWHYLNMSNKSSLTEYTGGKELILDVMDAFLYELWSMVNKSYTPEGF
jgi:hypothetical protein